MKTDSFYKYKKKITVERKKNAKKRRGQNLLYWEKKKIKTIFFYECKNIAKDGKRQKIMQNFRSQNEIYWTKKLKQVSFCECQKIASERVKSLKIA